MFESCEAEECELLFCIFIYLSLFLIARIVSDSFDLLPRWLIVVLWRLESAWLVVPPLPLV